MRKSLAFLFSVMISTAWTSPAQASEFTRFLRTCAWGTLGGALVGTASLILEDKPSEHTINIARGASLGLYAGIIYGLSRPPENSQAPNVDELSSFWFELKPPTTTVPSQELQARWLYRF